MTLSTKHVKNICLLNQGQACCRYLGLDDVDFSKYHCLKHKTELRKKIDDYVNKQSNLKDPSNKNLPVGNNCQGYPVLKNIEQGYDV